MTLMDEKKYFIAFAIIIFTTIITDRMLFVVFPNYLIDKQFSPIQIGLIFSIGGIILMLSRPFIGKISDFYGRKIIMSIGFVIESVSIFFYTIVNSFLGFSLTKGVQQTSETLIDSVEDALIGDVFSKKTRAKIISKLGVVHAASRAIAAMLGFFVVTYFALTYGFYAAALASILSLLVVIFLIKEPKRQRKEIPFSLKIKKYSKNFYKISVIGFLQELAFGVAYSPAFFLLARNLGINEGNLFLFLLVAYVINSFVLYILNRKKENLGSKNIFTYGLILYSIGIFLYTLVSSQFQFLLVILLVNLSYYIYRVGYKLFSINLAAPKTRGEQIGFSQTMIGIGGIIGPTIGGFVIEFVSLNLAFILSGLSIVIAVLILRGIREV